MNTLVPLYETSTWDPRALDIKAVYRDCPHCGGSSRLNVSLFMYMQWRSKVNIQDVWPHVSPDQREVMITGYHSACFDDIFGDDDE